MRSANRPTLLTPGTQSTKNSTSKRLWLAAAVVLMIPLGVSPVSAISLTPSSTAVTTSYNSTIDTPEEWLTYLGIANVPDLLYKSEVSGTTGLGNDEGPYANSYQTTFSNSASDPADALIQYLGGGSIGCAACYLLVKGGNTDPAQYLFKLTN